MIEWIALFAIAFAIFYWMYLPPKGYPPGPPIKPFIGSFPSLKNTQLHFWMEDAREKYGPVIGTKLNSRHVVFVTGPKLVREVLKDEKLLGRPNFTRNINNPRKGIIFREHESWKEQRNFAVRHLREFGFGKSSLGDLILQEADEFSNRFGQKERVQVSKLFSTSTVNVIWALMSGSRFSHDDPELLELLDGLDKTFHSPNRSFAFIRALAIVQKHFPKWSGALEAQENEKRLKKLFQKTFKEHRQTKEAEPRDFIDSYLNELEKPDHKESFTEETMMAVCMDLFGGGGDSIANTLSFCVLYLVLYPEWQKKLFNEINDWLGSSGRVSLSHQKSLPHVSAFLSEVQRANTVAPISVPRRATEGARIGSFHVPKDTIVFISQWSCLKDKEHWGDPEIFRPDRFINEDGSCRKDDWLIVFGDGKRACIGDTFTRDFLFLFCVDLIQKFEFKLPEGHPKPSTIGLSGVTSAPRPFEADVLRRQ